MLSVCVYVWLTVHIVDPWRVWTAIQESQPKERGETGLFAGWIARLYKGQEAYVYSNCYINWFICICKKLFWICDELHEICKSYWQCRTLSTYYKTCDCLNPKPCLYVNLYDDLWLYFIVLFEIDVYLSFISGRYMLIVHYQCVIV